MGAAPPQIDLANGSASEVRTREMLLGLFDAHPLGKWAYADRVRIEHDVIPHSHPVLTLNTNVDRANPLRLLSTYVHEQLHWFWLLEQHEARPILVMREVRRTFPALPVQPPEGCGSGFSNHLHIAINYLELLALGELVGTKRARDFLGGKPYYTAIYALVLAESDTIHAILERNALIPPPEPPESRRFVDPSPRSPFPPA